MESATEITRVIQARVNREDTLRLLRRAGAAARGSNGEMTPADILMLKRLMDGDSVDKIARMSNGKLIKLARAHGGERSGG